MRFTAYLINYAGKCPKPVTIQYSPTALPAQPTTNRRRCALYCLSMDWIVMDEMPPVSDRGLGPLSVTGRLAAAAVTIAILAASSPTVWRSFIITIMLYLDICGYDPHNGVRAPLWMFNFILHPSPRRPKSCALICKNGWLFSWIYRFA